MRNPFKKQYTRGDGPSALEDIWARFADPEFQRAPLETKIWETREAAAAIRAYLGPMAGSDVIDVVLRCPDDPYNKLPYNKYDGDLRLTPNRRLFLSELIQLRFSQTEGVPAPLGTFQRLILGAIVEDLAVSRV